VAGPVVTGDNYSIALEGVRATVTVWRRPDLDSAAGARAAGELAREVAALPRKGVREIILDLSEAPPVAGPKTTESLGQLLRTAASAGARIAVVVGGDAVQKLQMKRLVADNAPAQARVVTDAEAAEHWFMPPSRR